MPSRALTNDDWGFATNCFVCEPRNEAGLRIPFFHETSFDTDDDRVVAEFELDDRFSGAPNWAHGGVSLAICDEAMAWATIAICNKWAVTKSSPARFERPVQLGKRYRCVARLTRIDDASIDAMAVIESVSSGVACVVAEATMSIVTTIQAPTLGITMSEHLEGYLREPPQ